MEKSTLSTRPCLWTGQMFTPGNVGQLFATREAAEAFEASGFEVAVLNPAHKDVLRFKVERLSETKDA